ncbi:MAG: methionine--tRNA ligase [Alphaproteobacteria bacterium]
MAPQTYSLTTPIYYVNDRPHIGHAYTTLACDALARFMRLDGREVHFLTGTDEHGQKVEKSARAAGKDPKTFTDEVSQNFRRLAADMNYSHDQFIRTTEERHIRASQAIWKAIKDNGHIYLGKYAGWYAVRDEAYYAESEITEKDGRKVGPSGAEVEWVEEPSYFFDLSKWQQPLLDLYERNPGFIGPDSRRNEVISFVRGGLNDLSVSRTSFTWGVPVPDDPAHIMYVWLDALTNYITAIGYPDVGAEEFRKFWPNDLHMVGKDIIRFHAVYWPAFLMAAGLEPPKRIFAHGWLLSRGEKMSKSLGNIVRAEDLVAQYGLDPVRYYLLREVPFGQDGYISHETMVGRLNGDLANDFGNLAQRALAMIARFAEAKVPTPGTLSADDRKLLDSAAGVLDQLRPLYAEQAFHRALEALWVVVGDANRYFDAQAPWALRKSDPARMATVLWTTAECVRRLAILVQPVMPGSAEKLLDQLAAPAGARSFAHLSDAHALAAGTALPAPQPVFPRYVEERPAAQ